MTTTTAGDTDGHADARETQLLALTGSIQDAVICIDSDEQIVFWNPAAEQMFGWSEGEAMGQRLVMLVPERFHDPHHAGIARVVRGEVPRLIGGPPVELVARRRDGSELEVELVLGRYYERQRQFFTGVLRDNTERMRRRRYETTQERVAKVLLADGDEVELAEQTLGALGEGLGWSHGALWLNDASEQTVLDCCATWSAPGVDAQRLVRRSHELHLTLEQGFPGHVAAARSTVWIDDATQSGVVVRQDELREAGLHAAVGLPLLAGEDLVGIIEFFLPEAQTEDAELAGLVEALSGQLAWVFLRKRSQRQLEAQAGELASRAEELERSNEDLERFAYVASHDLSEPLRTIAGFVQLLRDRHAGQLDDQGIEFLDFAQQGAVRMRAIIDDLLSYSRAGRAELHPAPVDLGQLARDVVATISRQIEDAGASVHIAEDLPTVTGDPRQLYQVFQNLISNAVKFRGDEAPRVEVSAVRLDGPVAIAIEDNGIGIESAHAERVFEMFVRLHRRETYEGTGIGLALCRRILERHGGTIEAGPGAEGGTRILLTLPAA